MQINGNCNKELKSVCKKVHHAFQMHFDTLLACA